jgi:periplasmic protein TonB
MVGIPPRGNGGGENRPSPQVPAKPAAPQETSTPKAPETPEKPAPTPPPDKAAAKVLPKAAPTPVAKPLPGPSTSKPVSATGTAKTESVSSPSGPAAAGPHPGTPGRPDGDTLSVSGAQGLPSPMALWLSRVKYSVERNWRAPEGLAGVSAMPEVVFQVARDGRPSRVQLKTKSGNPTLDRLALRAVQAVETFPPVPDVWPQNDVVVRYVLQYASQ